MEGSSFRPDGITILVVDDNDSERLTLQTLLGGQGYHVVTAKNGLEALDQLRQGFAAPETAGLRMPTASISDQATSLSRPSLLISDISMPRMNGYQLCAAIKTDPLLHHLPVILLTTLSRSEDILRALEARANYYLTKPLDERYLLSRIQTLIESPPLADDDEVAEPLDVVVNGMRHVVSAGRRQMLNLLLCTYEHAVHQNRALTEVQSALHIQAEGLAASRANYRLLLENSDDAMIVIDAEGAVRYTNTAARKLFDRRSEELLTPPFDWPLSDKEIREVVIARPKKDRRASERNVMDKVIAELRVGVTEWEGAPAWMATLRDITADKHSAEQIAKQQRELRLANAALERLATIDSLTALKNRRALKERLADEMRRASRYRQPLSLIMLDVDHFKQYNDSFLHLAGDEVLQRLGKILQESARTSDFAARYGGEEFAILLPNTDNANALILAERLRTTIQDTEWPFRPITASLGVATMIPTAVGDEALREQSERLIITADRALYLSKANGRNQSSHTDLGQC